MNHITSSSVMTRDGYHLPGTVNLIAERHRESERAAMLAMMARIEARLELERALKRASGPMATPTPITRQPGAMASRNPGRIHPAPLRDDCEGFDRADRIFGAAIQALLLIAVVMAAVMAAVVLAGGAG